ncbi:MAG: flagellin FliC [Halobacteriovorax sp.]|nr:flagellin FliC [Halobacteriovorax sp.]|tara:strand:+ start:420986 stop:421816 length:831 start_codon:yes stop_codon:yes gene_type:complete
MGLRIRTNVPSIQATNSLQKVKRDEFKTLQKLSSGSRINSASDDAAGLAISEKLRSQIRSGNQAQRNANDGISLVQTAEGGMNEVSNLLIRLRELSIQSASDTVGADERKFSDLEAQELATEIDRIAKSTEFNGRKLLSGEGGQVDLQVGIGNDEVADRITYRPEEGNVSLDALGVSGINVATKDDARNNLERIDNALNIVNGNRAQLGAIQNRLQVTMSNLEVQTENLSAANSRIRDADIAVESANLAKQRILSEANTSVLSQTNGSMNSALKLI